MSFRIASSLVATCLFVTADAGRADFDTEVAPLFAGRCLSCHSGAEPKGGLDMSGRKSFMKGGESGAVVSPGSVDESLLWEHVRDDDMPPKNPLPAAEKQILKKWIGGGARWGTDPIDAFRYSTDIRSGYDWWSLQPVKQPEKPRVTNAAWPRQPLDFHILHGLESAGLSPSPSADRRTLIRRLSYDLLGLPPRPEDVERFVNDPDPKAYEKLIDRLLDSPHYGERWARHWLDVARFGESDGFEYDRPRDNAWPYRDWVINALNDDMPYDEFARLQLAGDLLQPGDAEAITATGFLVGGAFDGLKPAGDKMRSIMRQDELDDLVAVVSQTFLGLTVNCARCHDHKFDPIYQSDYYGMASALSGIHRGDRNVKTGGDAAGLQERVEQITSEIAAIESPIRTSILEEKSKASRKPLGPQPMARWTFDEDLRDQIGSLHAEGKEGAKIANGRLLLNGGSAYAATGPIPRDLGEKTLSVWVNLADLQQKGGGAITVQGTNGATFDSVVFAEKQSGQWMAGSDAFSRWKSFNGPTETRADSQLVHFAIVYDRDGTITGYRNGQPYGKPYKSRGMVTYRAGTAQVVFGMRHGTSASGGRMLSGAIDRAELFDRALTAQEVAASAGTAFVTQKEVLARLPAQQREHRQELSVELARHKADLARIKVSKVYAVTPKTAPVVHVLHRGSPFEPGEAVEPSGVKSVVGISSDFGLKPSAPESDRRKKLAEWITNEKNPLFSRTIVNRVWHYHFGVGLVETPNDLGFNGRQPSSLATLDHLAEELIANGWSLKRLHKTILMSATYRQSSRFRPEAAKVDAGNRKLWRKSPMRLEAEIVRDAVLSVAGKLNATIGGRGYEDFRKVNEKSTWRYDPIDREGDEFNRRTIYRTWARGGRNPLLDTFDCPDPSTTAPARGVTTTPLQALVLLNNPFVLRMSEQLARRVTTESGEAPRKQVKRVYRLAFGRDASDDELKISGEFVQRYGLPAFCRVILNTNEFLYVK